MQCRPLPDWVAVISVPVDVTVPFSVPAMLWNSREPLVKVVTDQLFVQLLQVRELMLALAGPSPGFSKAPSTTELHSIVMPSPEVSWRIAWPSVAAMRLALL